MFYAVLGGIWFLSLVVIFFLGFYLRTISDRIKKLATTLDALTEQLAKKKQKEEEQKPTSSFIDLEDAGEIIRWEHEQAMKRLNPEQYND